MKKANHSGTRNQPGDGGSFTRTFIEAVAALLFAVIVISQLQPGEPMEQARTKEQQIQAVQLQIKELSAGLPYASGEKYGKDQARLAELHRQLQELGK